MKENQADPPVHAGELIMVDSHSGSYVPINSDVQSSSGKEQAGKDRHIDNSSADINVTGIIGSSEALSGCPDDQREHYTNGICQVRENTEDP